MPDVGADVRGLVDRAVDSVDRLASDAGGSGLGGWRRGLRQIWKWSRVGRLGGDGGVPGWGGQGEVVGVEAVPCVRYLVWGWSGLELLVSEVDLM